MFKFECTRSLQITLHFVLYRKVAISYNMKSENNVLVIKE